MTKSSISQGGAREEHHSIALALFLFVAQSAAAQHGQTEDDSSPGAQEAVRIPGRKAAAYFFSR
jgi:hypothetical protein